MAIPIWPRPITFPKYSANGGCSPARSEVRSVKNGAFQRAPSLAGFGFTLE